MDSLLSLVALECLWGLGHNCVRSWAHMGFTCGESQVVRRERDIEAQGDGVFILCQTAELRSGRKLF